MKYESTAAPSFVDITNFFGWVLSDMILQKLMLSAASLAIAKMSKAGKRNCLKISKLSPNDSAAAN